MVNLNLARAQKSRPLAIKDDESEDRVLRIDGVERRASKGGLNPGRPLLHVEMIVEDDQAPEDDGVRIFREFALDDDTSMGWLKELLEAAWGTLEGDAEGDFNFEPEELIGELVVGSCYNEWYQGSNYPRVGMTMALEGAEEGSAEEPAPETPEVSAESSEETEEAAETVPAAPRRRAAR